MHNTLISVRINLMVSVIAFRIISGMWKHVFMKAANIENENLTI